MTCPPFPPSPDLATLPPTVAPSLFSPPVPSESLLYLRLSAQCSRGRCDPTRADSCRGLPSLSSPQPRFPSSSSPSFSSSFASNFFLSTSSTSSALGHRGANHQCSHRPSRHLYGCFYPGTVWPPSHKVEVLFALPSSADMNGQVVRFHVYVVKSDGSKAAKSGQCNSVSVFK